MHSTQWFFKILSLIVLVIWLQHTSDPNMVFVVGSVVEKLATVARERAISYHLVNAYARTFNDLFGRLWVLKGIGGSLSVVCHLKASHWEMPEFGARMELKLFMGFEVFL